MTAIEELVTHSRVIEEEEEEEEEDEFDDHPADVMDQYQDFDY